MKGGFSKKLLVGEEIRTGLKGKGMQCLLEHGRILHAQAGDEQWAGVADGSTLSGSKYLCHLTVGIAHGY